MTERLIIDLDRRRVTFTGLVTAISTGFVSGVGLHPALAQTAGGDTLLEVKTAGGEVVAFDLAALDGLQQHSFTTATNWTDGVLTFSGPPLVATLAAAGVPRGTVLASAANNYAANLTFPPADELVPILATRIDGELIPRREKGPLWVVFPFDSDPEFRTAAVLSQSVWQVVTLSADPADLI